MKRNNDYQIRLTFLIRTMQKSGASLPPNENVKCSLNFKLPRVYTESDLSVNFTATHILPPKHNFRITRPQNIERPALT